MAGMNFPKLGLNTTGASFAIAWLSAVSIALSWIIGEKRHFDKFWWTILVVAIIGAVANLTTWGQIFNLSITILLCIVGIYYTYFN